MTLEEQFEKETGHTRPKEDDLGLWQDKYIEWLEEKLTWKSFKEQKPELGGSVIVKGGRIIKINAEVLELSVKNFPEREWMYVPD